MEKEIHITVPRIDNMTERVNQHLNPIIGSNIRRLQEECGLKSTEVIAKQFREYYDKKYAIDPTGEPLYPYSDSTSNLRGATETVVDSITNVATNIEECSKGVSEVASSISNIATELVTIREVSETNNENIKELDKLLSQFH